MSKKNAPVKDETTDKVSKDKDVKAVANKPEKAKAQKPKSDRPKFFSRLSKTFREMVSELKKVDWPPFKRTKNHSGVLSQTGTVLVVVVFFLIFISLFDAGLLALLNLLTKG